MKTTRREIVRMATLAFAGAPLAAADRVEEADPHAIRQRLGQNRERVRTLRVRYTHAGRAADPMNGPNEMLFDGGRYRIRHESSERPLFMIVTPQESVTALGDHGQVRKLRYQPTKNWPPAPSLHHFLPVPADLPAAVLGKVMIAGEECIGLAQGEHKYWVSVTRPAVVRREVLTRTGQLQVVEDFSAFREIQEGVVFPGRIDFEIYDRRGEVARTATVFIDEVSLNETFDPDLFDIGRYRREKRKAV